MSAQLRSAQANSAALIREVQSLKAQAGMGGGAVGRAVPEASLAPAPFGSSTLDTLVDDDIFADANR